MSSSSKLFDKIRIGPRSRRSAAEAEPPRCEHPGCTEPGPHRAPKGRGSEGRFWQFCMAHVREYNQSYNYFAGMTDDAILSYQKDALIGHRPTWKLGENAASGKRSPRKTAEDSVYVDPFDLFSGSDKGKKRAKAEAQQPKYGPLTLRAFETLSLEVTAGPDAIRLRYKELVKRFHPDANGGDRSLEDRFREIIAAYNTLKTAGLA
jgi:hypothetical protein